MKNKKYHNVRKVPKSNRKIVETEIWRKPFSFFFPLKLFKGKYGPTSGEVQYRKMCPVWVLTKDKYTLYILRMSALPFFSWFIMFNEFFNTISSGKVPRHILSLCQSGMTPPTPSKSSSHDVEMTINKHNHTYTRLIK